MLTPTFTITQDEKFLYVKIRAPYAQISAVEVHFEDDMFLFSSHPYYLRLNLPGKVLYQENPDVKYDFDEKTFMVTVPKAEPGKMFQGLDLITMLLTKKTKASAPMIEVIEGTDEQEYREVDWSCDLPPPEDIQITGQQCGFGNLYSYDVFKLEEEVNEIFEITQPKGKTFSDRRKERLEKESNKFDEDYYIADLFENEEIKDLINSTCSWDKDFEELSCSSADSLDEKIIFNEEEKFVLKNLPKKEYLLDANEHKTALLGLVDILFGYAYNKRTTEGENTVGSAWTINKLSATLSWLEVFSSIEDVVVTCLRRSLIYPLYRHFELSLTVLEDVVKILKLGRKYVMKCLLEIRELFLNNEPRYILNDLYLKDYNVWIQTKGCSSSTLRSLAEALEKVLLTKGDVGLDLVDVECLAISTVMNQHASFTKTNKQTSSTSEAGAQKSENGEASDLSSQLRNLRVDEDDDSSYTEDSSSCSSSSDSSDSDSEEYSDSSESDSSSSSSSYSLDGYDDSERKE